MMLKGPLTSQQPVRCPCIGPIFFKRQVGQQNYGKSGIGLCWVTDCRAWGFGQKFALWSLSFDAGLKAQQ